MMIILDKDNKFHFGYCGHNIRCPATADKATPFGREIASLRDCPLKIEHKKNLTFIVRAEVEKIGLTSTSFGINLSPIKN
jgi:hypothetical protein